MTPLHRFARATLALIALTLVGAACSSSTHGTTGTATTAPSGTTPTTTGPALLSSGQEGPASAVPWSQVGPGWFLAKWGPSPVQITAALTTTDPPGTVIYLVDPQGGRYRIASGAAVPAGALIAWSSDGQRALFESQTAGAPTPTYQLLNLTTGGADPIPLQPGLGGQTRTVEFTKPHGLGIVESGSYTSSPSAVVPVQRFDLSGHLQVSYSMGGYPPMSAQAPASGPIPFLYTPDGTQLLIATVGGLALVGNGGQLANSTNVADPAGSMGCTPVEWWAYNEVLASCITANGVTLWLVPMDHNPPTELATEGAGADKAWQLTSGIFATDPKCIGSACTGVGRLNPDGTAIAPIGVLGRAPGQAVLVAGASADQLAIFGPPTLPATGFLEWLNPDTGATTPLLGGSLNGGSVNQVLAQPAAAPAPTTAQLASSPHFSTPQAAMTYLASAWNRNDLTELDFVTDPAARAALGDMHADATNLRLNHCTARTGLGDYICYFDHDFLPASTTTTVPGETGQAVFLVAPARTPGWYMTIFETCN